MSIHTPPKNWFKAPAGPEKMWIGVALIWCLIMFSAMPFWHIKGKQNSTGESYSVNPTDFMARVTRFVETNKVGEENNIPIVEGVPGGDVYLLGQMWRWYPILKLKVGQTYRLHISSVDLQHGLSLQPMNMNFQILPGYDHVLTITPTTKGTFSIICNEFCGIGHHLMTGRIIVE
ncbi:MAG: cytochrome C oxidase subunit II [Calditrichaeota bacterium]|nr:MAG: cytochrome C oxidase subunit II [Calditrichota bacterium]